MYVISHWNCLFDIENNNKESTKRRKEREDIAMLGITPYSPIILTLTTLKNDFRKILNYWCNYFRVITNVSCLSQKSCISNFFFCMNSILVVHKNKVKKERRRRRRRKELANLDLLFLYAACVRQARELPDQRAARRHVLHNSSCISSQKPTTRLAVVRWTTLRK